MANSEGGDRGSIGPTENDVAIALDVGKTKRTEARWASAATGAKAISAVVGVVLGYVFVPSPTTVIVWFVLAVVFAGGAAKIAWDRSMKKNMRVTISKLEADNDRLQTRVDELVDRLTTQDERNGQ